jgi:hypothetical protein
MTGTSVIGLDGLCVKVLRRYTCPRAHPRAIVPFPVFTDLSFMVRCLSDAVVMCWQTALISREQSRTAIFVEDKLILKAIRCMAVSKICDPAFDLKSPYMGSSMSPYTDKETRKLGDQIREDPLIALDKFA